MRSFIGVTAALSTAIVAHAAAAGDSHTTRIETKPYYGATVTLEAGSVRVWRALPPTRHLIVNPEGNARVYVGDGAGGIGGGAGAAAGGSHTTRIETKPYYGATVTLEAGKVRVWRPLPPTRHMIINPDGAAPLYLMPR